MCVEQITVVGQSNTPTIKEYLQQNFNYRYSFIGPVIGILLGFTVFFGGLAIGAPSSAVPNPTGPYQLFWVLIPCGKTSTFHF